MPVSAGLGHLRAKASEQHLRLKYKFGGFAELKLGKCLSFQKNVHSCWASLALGSCPELWAGAPVDITS